VYLLIGAFVVIAFERQRIELAYNNSGAIAASALFITESLACALMVFLASWILIPPIG
jgi:hypothetical protein